MAKRIGETRSNSCYTRLVSRRIVAIAVALVFALVLVLPAAASAPNYIRVTGPGLAKPVLLSDWHRNLDVMLAIENSPVIRRLAAARLLGSRPRLAFTLYWNWTGLGKPTGKEKAQECLTSSNGCAQRGWFYPAYQGRPAVADFIYNYVFVPRLASHNLLSLLRSARIPVAES